MVKVVPPWLRVASTLLVALTVLFLLAPLVVVIGVSFSESEFIAFPPKGFSLRWYEGVLTSNTYLASALTSLQIAVLVTITTTLVGGAAAVALPASACSARSNSRASSAAAYSGVPGCSRNSSWGG